MKKKLKTCFPQRSPWLRGLCLGLCLLAVTVGMVGCGKKRGNSTTETTETQAMTEAVTYPVTEPSSSETESLSDTLKAYYESLIQELRDELLQEREDRYISDHEYKSRLEELEAALKAWEETTKEDDKPTVVEPDTEPPEETTPSVSTAPFDYRMENGQVIITAYKGKETTVTIPTEIDGYPVTAIDDHAFQNTSVVSVIIPSSVTSVGWFAFYGCFGLEIVAIPSSVTTISYAAFDGCPNLTLLCPADSYAAKYAVSFGLKHEYV